VVLNVCVGNDVLDNALPVYLYDGATPKPYFTARGGALELHAEDVRLPLPSLLARRLVEGSLALDALRLLAGGATRAPLDHDDGEHWGPRARAVLERWPEAEALTRLLVARVAEGCARQGARLVVLLHPNRRAYEGDDEWVRAFRPGVPPGGTARVLDLREAYGQRGLRWEDFTLDKLGHLNPQGHRVVAEVLKEALAE
jgi:hypothetical protein